MFTEWNTMYCMWGEVIVGSSFIIELEKGLYSTRLLLGSYA